MKTWLPPALGFALVCLFVAFVPPASAQTIAWTGDSVATGLASPTRIAFGPDGRLYVLELSGRLRIYTLGRDHKPTAVQIVSTIPTYVCCPSYACLGIAFDPLDPPDSVRVYVSRTQVYQPASSGAYLGHIVKLTGPDFAVPVDVITGLPVARFDHGTNGILFGNDGQLYIQNGGNTNAGMPGAGLNGYRDEGPLSANTLIAHLRRPNFDGQITYSSPDPGLATQVGGLDVEPFAYGERNPYGIVQHSNNYFYGTDNGPNTNFNNDTMWRCDSTGPPVVYPDRLNLLERGNYYGHPNRNRARTDPRQCFFHPPTDGPVNGLTPALAVVQSSTDGLFEYRARTFGGAMRGDLVLARYGSYVSRAQLSADGRAVLSYTQPFPLNLYGALDLCSGPDGSIYAARYDYGDVQFIAPVDPGPAAAPRAFAMWPERGPTTGSRASKIYGRRLGLLAPVSVKLGGTALAVTAFDSSSISVTVPAGFPAGWRDLVVVTPEGADTLTRAYCVIKPNLADDDHIPPIVEESVPERRWFDRTPPSFGLSAHDRLGLDSLRISFDSGPWQNLVIGSPDTIFTTTVNVPAATWSAAANGLHTVNILATDDAHNVTADGWSWFKGLPASGAFRINCGGPPATTTNGLAFGADSAYVTGQSIATNAGISNTVDPALYLDAREGVAGASLWYDLTVPSRSYQLHLHFAEIDSAFMCTGCRVFTVRAEGDTLVPNLDLYASGGYVAQDLSRDADVVDGQLLLDFPARRGVPLISAIEVYPLGTDDVTPPTIAAIPEPAGVTYDNPPLVSLAGADPNDGELAGFWYSLDGGALQPAVRQLHRKSYAARWTLPGYAFQLLGVGMHTLQLHAVDLAGHLASTPPWSFGRSSIVGVAPLDPGKPVLQLWPNPARGSDVRVRFAQPRSGVVQLEVFDLAGRLAHRQDLGWRPAGAGDAAIDMNRAGLAPGLYFVRLKAPGVNLVQRFARMP